MRSYSHEVSRMGESIQTASGVVVAGGLGVQGGTWAGGAGGGRRVPAAHQTHLTKQLFGNQQGSGSGKMRKD